MSAETSAPSTFLPLDEALERIRAGLSPVEGYQQLALRDALGRVLAEDVLSPIDVPAYTNSAMDGYAVRADDLAADGETRLTVAGTAFAGQPYDAAVQAGQAVRIMTGAMLPEGADTVVMQEDAERDGDELTLRPGHKPGQHVRHAGEDIAAGGTALAAGKRLRPSEIGLLASLGVPEVRVRRRLRVAFFSTGDELRSIGEPLEAGQIYDSNRYTLHGMLTRLGVEQLDMGVIPDRREAVEDAFKQAAAVADVVITSGGVSVGEADYVKETLDSLGEVGFWKIAMKPGKPLAFGRVADAVFFGLPGNPVSAMATFYQVVQPALRHMLGEKEVLPVRLQARCVEGFKKRPGRQDFQRGVLRHDEGGQLVVTSTGAQGSHVLSSMSRANCFIVLSADSGNVEAGELVEVQPFEGLV